VRREQSTVKDTSTKPKETAQPEEVVVTSSVSSEGQAYFPASQQFDPPAAEGIDVNEPGNTHDWSKSFHGLSTQPFSSEVAEILMQPVNADDIEVKPGNVITCSLDKQCDYNVVMNFLSPTDGLLYLPEIKYRRILNKAFGPGGWGLAPRGEHSISPKNISREYALICHGRYVELL
jgi:hypothetical protein